MTRRAFVRGAVLAALGLGWARVAEARFDAETIKAALRTATPEEDGFIEYVVARVDQGTLPADLVESTLQWARTKPRHRFQYFRRGLILRAAERGIRL
jgi:hypothetical protein